MSYPPKGCVWPSQADLGRLRCARSSGTWQHLEYRRCRPAVRRRLQWPDGKRRDHHLLSELQTRPHVPDHQRPVLAAEEVQLNRSSGSGRIATTSTSIGAIGHNETLEELVAELQASSEDPHELIDLAIERTSDEDLISITSAIARIDAETLRRSHDVRAFARRLAEVAIGGITDETRQPSGAERALFPLRPKVSPTMSRSTSPRSERRFGVAAGRWGAASCSSPPWWCWSPSS